MKAHQKASSDTEYLSFLRLALVDFYSLWDSGANSSRGRCSSVCREAACDSNWLYVRWGKKHLSSTCSIPGFALFYIYLHPLFIRSEILIKLLLFPRH